MTWLQTSTGRAFDLLNPTPDMVDLRIDVAEALARIPRFGGHVSMGPYSAAQHSVIGADAIMAKTRDASLAAAFLLHDAHEAYLGDITTPVQQALAGSFEEMLPGAGHRHLTALNRLKIRIDVAIHAAAGVPFPHADAVRKVIKDMDLSLLLAERQALLATPPKPWADHVERAPRLRIGMGKFKPQPWPAAAADFVDRLNRYCPPARARAA